MLGQIAYTGLVVSVYCFFNYAVDSKLFTGVTPRYPPRHIFQYLHPTYPWYHVHEACACRNYKSRPCSCAESRAYDRTRAMDMVENMACRYQW